MDLPSRFVLIPVADCFLNGENKFVFNILSYNLAALMAAPGAELPLVNISFGPVDLFKTLDKSPMGGT